MAEKKKTFGETVKGMFTKGKPEKEISAAEITRAEAQYGYDPVTVSMLLGSGKRIARSRQTIYEKLHYMMGDPIIGAAVRLHVTNALGGDPASGDRVFIEATPDAGDKGKKIAEELSDDLSEIFNKIAFPVGVNAVGYGDAYARPYIKPKVGIVDIYTDEMIWPPLVQSYEQGSRTVGFTVFVGKNFVERMTIKQIVRMKMPRTNYVAQNAVVEKAVRVTLTEDDVEKLPIQPAMVGGSLLLQAEEPYDWLQTALMGMIGQRVISSIDENILTVNTDSMTKEQRKKVLDSIKKMLTATKLRVEEAVKTGTPITERIYHVMPTNGEKQITSVSQFNDTSGAQAYNVEDVMTYAKMLAGSLGIDLSMLGFADLLSGGLGEGGFFRTSAQAAEVSQMIRTTLNDFFNELIDLHCYAKFGYVFDKKDRPYRVNFYGSISALEGEKAASKERSMNGTMLMGQAIGTLKELGLKADTLEKIMVYEMALDAEMAKIIAKDLEQAAKQEQEAGGFGGGGGGFGGGPDDGGIDVDGSGDAAGDGVDDKQNG